MGNDNANSDKEKFIQKALRNFIKSLKYEKFQKGLDSIGVIDRIEFDGKPDFHQMDTNNEQGCGLENWYTGLQTAYRFHWSRCLTDSECLNNLLSDPEFKQSAKENWLADNCDNNVREFLRELANNSDAVTGYIGGDEDQEMKGTVRKVIKNIDGCIKDTYKDSIKKFLGKNENGEGEEESQNNEANVQENIRAFLRDVLNSIFAWLREKCINDLLLSNLTEFRQRARRWLAGNCEAPAIRVFLRVFVDNIDSVIGYIGGDKDQEGTVGEVIRGIGNIGNCIHRKYRDVIQQFVNNNIDENVQNQVRAFLRDVLNSVSRWIYSSLCCICGCGGNESLILGKLHHLIEGVRRGTIKQHEFCERVREIVDMMPYSKYFKEQYLEARLCNEGAKGGNQGAANTLCQGCDNIFYIYNNCETCYRCCASTLRRNSDDNIEIYRAEINGEIRRIYPYEENYKKWNFTGKVWFYLKNTSGKINDRILMGIMQIIYYSSERGSFGSILLEFEPDRNSQDSNSISGIFRGRYIKLMRHEGNVWHVRANTFPVEWLSEDKLCEFLRRDNLLRQVVDCPG